MIGRRLIRSLQSRFETLSRRREEARDGVNEEI
jgi:hypothetical protein